MNMIWQRFCKLHFLLKIIWIFCFLGVILNIIAIWHDLHGTGILLRLHIGFLALYASQVVFILLKERMIWLASVLQALLALATNLDFTFVPLLRLVGECIYLIHGQFSLDGWQVYKHVFVSACFTLGLLKTFFLWFLLLARKK